MHATRSSATTRHWKGWNEYKFLLLNLMWVLNNFHERVASPYNNNNWIVDCHMPLTVRFCERIIDYLHAILLNGLFSHTILITSHILPAASSWQLPRLRENFKYSSHRFHVQSNDWHFMLACKFQFFTALAIVLNFFVVLS